MGVLRATSGANASRLTGVGAYRPRRVVSNDEVCTYMDSSDEWIRERSGIVERRWAEPDETVASMGTWASEQALKYAGLPADAVDMIMVATLSHPYVTPSAAVEVADNLGITHVAAIDLSAACAGFSYGIGLADGLVRAGTATNVLVVGVERLMDYVDKSDRGTGFIFADGAGAAIVSGSDTVGIGPTVWGGDGSQREVIRAEPDLITARETPGTWPILQMQGQRVFRWAVGEMARVCREAIAAAGLTPDEIEVFIPHQANMRITDALVRSLQLPDHIVIARDIARQGNTSAASIPLAMDTLLSNGEAGSGQVALLVGFGAGLVYSAQVAHLP